MGKPLVVTTMYDSEEPDRNAVYMDKGGDFWWYGSDADGDVGWVWGLEDQIGGKNYECGYARNWGRSVGCDFPWDLVGLVKDGAFVDCRADGGLMIEEPVTVPIAGFVVKDSGVREEYDNGFVRDTEDGKYDYARILRIEGLHLIPIEALERWGAHMVKGAEKYGEDNWRQARGPVAVARFLRSLCRHVVQYIRKDRTEDHAAAVCFNVWAAELTPETEGDK